ncbi:MAG: protein kinase [Candidatus Obscuribacterales bacterium]|nr:protein kinase [Candidatus Obscuribacterales bacterium]
MLELEPGSIIDERYQLIKHLGEGGMGSVFSATELELNRTVAIKILHAGLLTDEEQRTRFEREGRILSSLSHPYLLKFYRFGLWQNTFPLIVMEYLEGKSLREELDSIARLSIARCVSLTRKLCSAMQSAHDAEIIHRDLKPNNIVLLTENNDETPKIVDFGLARALESGEQNQHLTQTGMLVGSVYYMSPEQCTGKKADKRSDIYSLGCVLYECLTGVPPLAADNPIALLHKHATESPVPTAIRLSDSPPDQVNQLKQLDAILFKALAKNPNERYQTMEAFSADLALFDEGKGSEISGALIPKEKRAPYLKPMLVTIVALIVLSTTCIVFQSHNTPQSPITLGTKPAPRSARGFLGQVEALRRMPEGADKVQRALLLTKKLEAGDQRISSAEASDVYGYLVSVYSQSQDYATLYGILDRAVSGFSKQPDTLALAKLFYFRADCGLHCARYADAEKDITRCLKMLHSLDAHSNEVGLANIVLSRYLCHQQQSAKAEQLLIECLERSDLDTVLQTQVHTELAGLYLAQGRLADERKLFDKALKTATDYHHIVCLMNLLSEWPQRCNATGHPEIIADRIQRIVQALETRSDAALQRVYCAAGFNCLLSKPQPALAERYFRLAAAQPTKPPGPSAEPQIYIGLCHALLTQSKMNEAHRVMIKATKLMSSPAESIDLLCLANDCAEADAIEDTDVIIEKVLRVCKEAKPQLPTLWSLFTRMWRRLPAQYQDSRGIEYLQKCIALLKETGASKLEIATAQQELSEILISNDCDREAKNLLDEALPVLTQINTERTTRAYNDMAQCCLALNAIPEAESWTKKGLEYARRNNQSRVSALHQAANVYNIAGLPERAGVLYEQAYNEKTKNKLESIAAASVLSSFYLQRRRFEEAEKIGTSVLPEARKLAASNPAIPVDLLCVLGTIHFNMKQYPQAYREFEEASKIGPRSAMTTVHSLALMFDCLNMGIQQPNTIEQQRKLLTTASLIPDIKNHPQLHHILRLRQAILLGKEGKTKDSLHALDNLCAEYDATRKPDDQAALVYECAANAYYAVKQFDKAISLQKQALTLRRSKWKNNNLDTRNCELTLQTYEKR